MKKIIPVVIVLSLMLCLAACSGKAAPGGASETEVPPASETPEGTQEDEAAETEAAPAENTASEGGVLVVFFSATGTTKGVAEKIAALENADLYEIKAAQEYTDDDLNWHDSASRTTKEQNDSSARPEIGSEPISLEGYSKIYVGYPIWWGEEPRIMDTFAESYDFTGKTLIPFCTSGGSGIGRSGQNLAENAGAGNWLEGQRFSGGVSEADLQSWIDELPLN